MITIIGFERSKGTFVADDGQKRDYDNTIVYGVEVCPGGKVIGDRTHVLKIKSTVVPFDKFKVSQKIEVFYDKWKNIAFVQFC